MKVNSPSNTSSVIEAVEMWENMDEASRNLAKVAVSFLNSAEMN